MSSEFKLSSVLHGHSLDVRALAVTKSDDILSGSRDKTAKFWKFNNLEGSYIDVQTYRDQKNFVGCVLYIEPTSDFPDGLVITGGNDSTILIYRPHEPFAFHTIKEHTNTVSCLCKCNDSDHFISGSWDATAKVWTLKDLSKAKLTLTGHQAAIWGVVQLSDNRIVTASADKLIGIWSSAGEKLAMLGGHSDCVRAVADFPEFNQFVSVSNDASIKIWTYSGENIKTLYGHTSFIYSIAKCKNGGPDSFVTSDEDRTVRYWVNGENVQSIVLPAQSIWAVACLNNGDIVTAASDGVIRIFTQNESRLANPETLTKFNEEVAALSAQSMQEIGGVKVSDLPGREALYDPGKKAGQMKMIREGGGVVAYTWVADNDGGHWDKVGDVLGGTDKDSSGKTMFEGQSYDFVFSVDVEDGKPPLKLPYNKGDDPYVAANNFLTKNFLPSTYLEQVVDFILKNSKENYIPQASNYVDPFTGGSRYTPGTSNTHLPPAGVNLDPFTGGSSYSTAHSSNSIPSSVTSGSNLDPFTGGSSYTTQETKYFPISTYRSFDIGDPKVILNKLKEFNEKNRGTNNFIEEEHLERFVDLCNGPPTDANSFDILFKLLEWPDDIIFPVLDVVRIAVKHQLNNEVICSMNNGFIVEKLIGYVNESCQVINNLIVSLRTICNLCLHEQGESLVFKSRFDILENVTALGQLNKNAQIALGTVLLNFTVLVFRQQDELGLSVLAEVLPDILTKLTDAEAHFRVYVALGTLILSAKTQVAEIKAKIKTNTNFLSTMQLHLLGNQGDIEIKRMKCAKQLQDVL